MMDWFFVPAGVIILLPILIDCCTYYHSFLLIGFVACIRYIFIPADCDFLLWFIERFGYPVERINGHVVWITGASSGIGRALAIRLAKAGVKVAISARSLENLNQVKQACIETGRVEAQDVMVLPFDMVQFDQHQAAFDAVIKHFGKLDILVNNAGRSQRGNWEMIELDVDRQLFDLNVFSVISLSRLVMKYFIEKGRGHFVVTSSVAGKAGAPLSASYTGSKHALHGYFECLRVEKAGLGLDITIACPGVVDSNLLRVCFTERKGKQLGLERKGKNMSAERCADLMAIAIANRMSEVWIANQPALLLMYMNQYLPVITKNVFRIIPLKFLMKIRDGRVDTIQETNVKKQKS